MTKFYERIKGFLFVINAKSIYTDRYFIIGDDKTTVIAEVTECADFSNLLYAIRTTELDYLELPISIDLFENLSYISIEKICKEQNWDLLIKGSVLK